MTHYCIKNARKILQKVTIRAGLESEILAMMGGFKFGKKQVTNEKKITNIENGLFPIHFLFPFCSQFVFFEQKNLKSL